jgi:hypothetical protein
VDLAQFGAVDLANVQAAWTITKQNGVTVAEGSLPGMPAKTGQLTRLGSMNAHLKDCSEASKLTVVVSLKGTEVANSWDVWIYPKRTAPPQLPSDMVILEFWGKEAKSALANGQRVLVLSHELRPSSSLAGSFLPVF